MKVRADNSKYEKKINALKFIYLVIQCFEHTNILLFQKCIYHNFFVITRFKAINIMSEGMFCRVEVHMQEKKQQQTPNSAQVPHKIVRHMYHTVTVAT